MHEDGGEPEKLAPVIPLFGGPVPDAPEQPTHDAASDARPDRTADGWNATWAEDVRSRPDDLNAADGGREVPGGDDGESTAEREAAEKILLRKLRTRSLSLREARGVLSEQKLAPDDIDAVIDDFVRLGYLDDRALAEQLVHSGVDRKGQGRQVISQTLAKRGIARDVADAVITELPDDDADRALEFARSKARSMASLDSDTALRRLAGQLARRGYGGSTAFTAARAALDEVAQARTPRVLFRDS